MDSDPVQSNPDLYSVIFENERVRVLEYRDQPGTRSVPHRHPDSVMVTLSAFERRLSSEDRSMEVALSAGAVRWVGAQTHSGENIGTTETHCIFVELKEPGPAPSAGESVLGPRDR